MDESLARLVWERASGVCEYCRLPQAYSRLTFEIDHIIARKHGGTTVASNLALACFYCNSYKGPNVAGIDLRSGKIVPLFHPRRQKWPRHFRWFGPQLMGLTASGRATIVVLEINDPEAVALREALIGEGVFPPP
jgi:HNH endonuclease